MENNRFHLANDPRWRDVDTLAELLAVLVGISEGIEVIIAHSRRFNVRNPVENFNEIRREAETIKVLLDKCRKFIATNLNLLEVVIRQSEGINEVLPAQNGKEHV